MRNVQRPARFGSVRKSAKGTRNNNAKLVSKIRRDDPYTSEWSSISYRVKRRDGFKCTKCSSRTHLETHHIIPVSRGGRNIECNMITLCHDCHAKQPGHGHLRRKTQKQQT